MESDKQRLTNAFFIYCPTRQRAGWPLHSITTILGKFLSWKYIRGKKYFAILTNSKPNYFTFANIYNFIFVIFI